MSKRFSIIFNWPAAVVTLAVLCAPGVALAAERPYAGDLGQAIATLVIFLALLIILGKFAWQPVVNQLKHREEDIAKRIEDAHSRQNEADELVQEYRDRLGNIDAEAEQTLNLARREATMESQRIREAAQSEAKEILKRAEDDIASARNQARKQLKAETAGMAADIAKQLLRKNLTPEDRKRLLSEATELIGQQAGDGS